MSAPVPSRAAIDRADPLTFEDRKPAKSDILIAVKASLDGFAIELSFTGTVDQLPAIVRRLHELGASPLVTPAQSGGNTPARKPNTGITPTYDGSGQAMCPVHHKALSEGRYGLFCPSKAQPGDAQNDKGYCSLKFAE